MREYRRWFWHVWLTGPYGPLLLIVGAFLFGSPPWNWRQPAGVAMLFVLPAMAWWRWQMDHEDDADGGGGETVGAGRP